MMKEQDAKCTLELLAAANRNSSGFVANAQTAHLAQFITNQQRARR